MNRQWTLLALFFGLLTAAATLGASRLALPMHDAVGRLVPGPQLPVVLVTIDTTPAQAQAQAQAAGARSVQMALPRAHPLLGGASPEARALQLDTDGRIRSTDGHRMRLPEARSALRQMQEAQLVGVGDTRPLDGMDVVLVYRPEGMGRAALLPGASQPVDRGVALAVAQGSHATGLWLRALPTGAAAGLTGLVALALVLLTRRRTPTAAWVWTGAGLALVCFGAWVLRLFAIDVPVGGLLLAAALPGPIRLVTASGKTLEVLDRLSLRIGGLYRWTDENIGPIEGLPTFLAMRFPGAQVAAFRARPSGDPVLVSHAGPDTGATRAMDAIPREAAGSPTRHIEPVYEQGEAIGALVMTHADALPTELVDLARGAARRTAWQYGPDHAALQDPIHARLNVLRRGVLHTIKTVTAWQALLSGGDRPIGIFDRNGDLVACNRALRTSLGSSTEAPLVSALRGLLVDDDAVAAALRGMDTDDRPRVVPTRTPHQTLRLSPLFSAEGPAGVLLQVEDAGPDRAHPATAGG